MPNTTISALPAGVAASNWKTLADDQAGTSTYYVTLGAIAFLMNDASNLTFGTLPDARLSGNVVLTGDVRLTNPRTPTTHASTHATGESDAIAPASIGAAAASHAHGNITNAGAIGATAGLPVLTGVGGVLTVGAFGTTAGTFCEGNDARLANNRAPTSHASTHQLDGADPVLPRDTTIALTGTVNNLDLTGWDIVRITTTGNVFLTGIVATAPVLLINENAANGGAVTMAHDSAGSTAGNRFWNRSLSDVTIQPDGGSTLAIKSTVINRWRTS